MPLLLLFVGTGLCPVRLFLLLLLSLHLFFKPPALLGDAVVSFAVAVFVGAPLVGALPLLFSAAERRLVIATRRKPVVENRKKIFFFLLILLPSPGGATESLANFVDIPCPGV
jgi:hypothetical protein